MGRGVIPWKLLLADIVSFLCKTVGGIITGFADGINVGIPVIGGIIQGVARAPFRILAFPLNLIGKLFIPLVIITIVVILIKVLLKRKAKQAVMKTAAQAVQANPVAGAVENTKAAPVLNAVKKMTGF